MEDWDQAHIRDRMLATLDKTRSPDGGQEDTYAVHPKASFPALFTGGSYELDSDTAAFGVVLQRCHVDHHMMGWSSGSLSDSRTHGPGIDAG